VQTFSQLADKSCIILIAIPDRRALGFGSRPDCRERWCPGRCRQRDAALQCKV